LLAEITIMGILLTLALYNRFKIARIMIKFTIRELMLQKGMNPTPNRLTVSGIGFTIAKKYLNESAKSIKLEDMEKLCYFFNCTPRELFCSTDEPYPIPDGHPLQEWRNESFPFPVQDLRTLSPKDMKLAQEALRKIINGEAKEINEDNNRLP
ncbi:MAG: XRE family transcriptional regulator, partial [Chitinophagaceae bacterium]